MRFDEMPDAVIKTDDTEAMKKAITLLGDAGLVAKRASDCQLKLDPYTSYYPDKGTLLVDGRRRHPLRGLAVLKAWIEKRQPRLTSGN